MSMTWQPMQPADLDAVMAIAAVVHVGFYERRDVFAERLALYPQGCWIARAEGGAGQAVGYAFMHPALLGQPPALDSFLEALDPQANCLYLHDVALLPAARSAGLGRALMQQLSMLMEKDGLAHAALVAVHGSAPYWRSCGFEVLADAPPALHAKLRSYDEHALYMIKPA